LTAAPPPPDSMWDISSCKDLKLNYRILTFPKAIDNVATKHFSLLELAFVASVANFLQALLKALATSQRSYVKKRLLLVKLVMMLLKVMPFLL